MLYDYLITQFYPNIPWLTFFNLVAIVASIVFYFSMRPDPGPWDPQEPKISFDKKWRKRLFAFIGPQILALLFYFWIPDVAYVKHFYGDVRVVEITPQQKAELQAQYDKHYEQSKQLLLDCLEKGQKQPHTTTFNDTNEVVKTCYNVAKYKF